MVRCLVFVALLSSAAAHFGLRHHVPLPQPHKGNIDPPAKWFTQELDHFRPMDGRTWEQRYFTNFDHYKEGGPVFLLIEGEWDAQAAYWINSGLWATLAEQQGAAMFILEHRFYGQSKPLEDLSTDNLVYLNSQQALADTAEFISAMNKENQLSGPWIAFGGSYPGCLAAWLRYRYPHLVECAVSSSGPMVAKIDNHEYFEVVMKALDSTGVDECNPAISDAIAEAEQLSTVEEGWAQLTELFTLCNEFDGSNAMDNFQFFSAIIVNLADIVKHNGQYDVTIDTICHLMANESRGTHLERFAQFNTEILNLFGNECLDIEYSTFLEALTDTSYGPAGPGNIGLRQIIYQFCAEFGWFRSSNQEEHPYGDKVQVELFEQQCTGAFGPDFGHNMLERVVADTNNQYGGKNPDIEKVVYVYGSIDPWSALGITEDLSPDAPAIFIEGTTHRDDLFPAKPDDPPQLIEARIRIGEYVDKWIKDYRDYM